MQTRELDRLDVTNDGQQACAGRRDGEPCRAAQGPGTCGRNSGTLACDGASPAELQSAWTRAASPSFAEMASLTMGVLGIAACTIAMCARYAPGPRWNWARARGLRVLAPVGFLASAFLAIALTPKPAEAPAS